jgi:hypothetical protein
MPVKPKPTRAIKDRVVQSFQGALEITGGGISRRENDHPDQHSL